MAFQIDLKKYQPLYTPLAIFVGFLVIAAAIYGSGGIKITTGGGQEPAEVPTEGSAVAGEEEVQGEFDNFAKCLTEKGAKLYVASTCGWCKKQKELFGDSIQYTTLIECYDESSGGWTEACIQAGLEGVPTWILKDGTKLVGVQTLEALAEKTGCPLN